MVVSAHVLNPPSFLKLVVQEEYTFAMAQCCVDDLSISPCGCTYMYVHACTRIWMHVSLYVGIGVCKCMWVCMCVCPSLCAFGCVPGVGIYEHSPVQQILTDGDGAVCGVRMDCGHVIDCERVVLASGMW